MKRKEVVVVFRKGKPELLTLTETKLKGNEEVSWCGINVQEIETAREGVAILFNDVMYSVAIDIGCISSKIMWIKFNLSRVKVCVVVGYSPNEGIGKERESLLNDMDRTVDGIGTGYRLYVLEHLNG